MHPITFPLHLNEGSEIVNLQDGLLLLLRRQIIRVSGADRLSHEKGVQNEQSQQIYGEFTKKLVALFQKQVRLSDSVKVDAPTAEALNKALIEFGAFDEEQFTVKGTIRLADDSPAVGIRVSACDRDLRHEQKLGQTKTDSQGFYQIQYSPQQFRKQGKGSAGLVVKALTNDDSLLAASPVLFNAPPVAEINLTISNKALLPPTLFERIGQVLEPLREGVNIENLEENEEHQDVSFLAGETGIKKSDLARFVVAHKLSENEARSRFRLEPEFWFALLRGSFYQFTEDQSLQNQLNTILKVFLL